MAVRAFGRGAEKRINEPDADGEEQKKQKKHTRTLRRVRLSGSGVSAFPVFSLQTEKK